MLKCREYQEETEKRKMILAVLETTILRCDLEFSVRHFLHSEY